MIGNLIRPDDVTRATPAPDLARNIWFGRDVDAMAAAGHTPSGSPRDRSEA